MNWTLAKKSYRRPMLNHRDTLATSFDTIFDELMRSHFGDSLGVTTSKAAYPKVNIIERDDHFEIVAELAGFSREDFEVQTDGDVLTICGKSHVETVENETYIMRELKRSHFSRSFTFENTVDMDSISAKFDNGLLTIMVPKVSPDDVPKIKKVTIE